MIPLLKAGLRFVALAASVVISMAVAGTISQRIPQPVISSAPDNSPIYVNLALAIVSVCWTALLAALARSTPGAYSKRAGFLFAIVFVVNCALSAVEAAYYLMGSRLQGMHIFAIVVNGVIAAALAALAAAAIIPASRASSRLQSSNRRAVVVVVLYIAAYTAAGYFIAWQSSAIREFYGADFHRQISLWGMFTLQIARAFVWLALLRACVALLHGHRVGMALLVGASFAGFMALPLLFPGPMLPWAVRRVHLVEIGVSNFLFGVASMLWMTADESRVANE